MDAGSTRPVRRRRCQAFSAVLSVFMCTVAAGQQTLTQAANAAEIGMADLERAFWACDYAATSRRVDASTAAVCGHYTEALKARKFHGEFGAMLDWWRANKQARHAALGATEQDLVARASNDQR